MAVDGERDVEQPMKRYWIVPFAALALMAGAAATSISFADSDAGGQPPAGQPSADAPDHPGPDGGFWHHHGNGMWHREDPLAKLSKPYSADQVKQALDEFFARRPQVKSVTEKGPDILVVEIADPDGKIYRFELNRTTGARRPAW